MPVVDELSIKLSLEAGDLQRGLELFIGKIAEAAQEIGQALAEGVVQAMQEVGAAAGEAGEASQQAAEAVSEVGEAAQEAGRQGAEGMREIGRASRQMRSQVSRDARMIEMASRRVTGHIKALVMRFAGPLVAGFTAGAMINNYISDLGKVAELTGAYNKQLEEERKKKAMLQRVTKEDLALYKKSREALVSFQIATQTVSNALIRAFGPAIEKIAGWLEKAADWLERNQDNIVRFAKVAAGVITTILMPAIIALGATILTSPFGWVMLVLGAIILLIDDLIVYINGGKTAFGGLWEKFGTGPEIAEKLKGAWEGVKNIFKAVVNFGAQVIELFESFWFYIKESAKSVQELWEAFQKFADIVSEAIGQTVYKINQFVNDAYKAIVDAFSNAGKAVMATWDAVCNWFAQKFQWLFGMIDKVKAGWNFVTGNGEKPTPWNWSKGTGQPAYTNPGSTAIPLGKKIEELTGQSVVGRFGPEKKESHINTTVNMNGTVINTQAKNAEGVAAGLGGALKGQFGGGLVPAANSGQNP